MKTIKFAAYLFYRYYSTGPTKDIPYVSTLCALAMIVFMHLFQVLILIHQVDTFFPFKSTDNRLTKYLFMALIFLPIFFLLRLFIKREELQSMSFPKDKIKRGNILLIAYVVLTMALLIVLMVFIPR